MDTLYLFVSEDNRYIGYVIINMAAVKVMEARCMDDVRAYVKDKGFKQYKWRTPREQKYQLIRSKTW